MLQLPNQIIHKTLHTESEIELNGNIINIDNIGNGSNDSNIHYIPHYNYPTNDDLLKLKNLLQKWNLLCVYKTCVGNSYTHINL